MNKNFKIIAIIIIAFGGLLFARERNLIGQEKKMSKAYADERDKDQKNITDVFVANSAVLLKKDQDISSCLSKVKPVALTMVKEEADILIAAVEAMNQAAKDSAERSSGSEKTVLAKLNRQNTFLVYFDKLENKQFSLNDEIRKLVYESNSYTSKAGTYTDLEVQEREKSLQRAVKAEYIVVVQPEKIKHGEITKANEFNAGYLIVKYDVFNIATKEKLKSSSVFASNSESLQALNSADINLMLHNDLLRQGKRAVIKIIYGTNIN